MSVHNLLKILLCSLLMALLAFDLLPVFVAGQERVDSEYAAIGWDAQVSKETISRGEQFFAAFDMVSTIKKTPGAPEYIRSIIGKLPSRAVLFYDVIARNKGDGTEILLGSFKISKSLPALKEGARIEFLDEKIPSEGYLEFPPEAGPGRYDLYTRFIKIEASVSIFHKNITGMVKDYLPPGAFDSGIKLAEIELIETPPSDITPPATTFEGSFTTESKPSSHWRIVWPGIIVIGIASLLVCLIIRKRRSARRAIL